MRIIRRRDRPVPTGHCKQLFRHVGRGTRWAAKISPSAAGISRPADVRRAGTDGGSDAAIEWLNGERPRQVIIAVDQVGSGRRVRRRRYSSGGGGLRPVHEVECIGPTPLLRASASSTTAVGAAADAISEWIEADGVQSRGWNPRSSVAARCICTPNRAGLGPTASGRSSTDLQVTGRPGPRSRQGRRGVARQRQGICCWRSCVEARHQSVDIEVFGETAVWDAWLNARRSEWRIFTTMTTSEIATVLAWHDALSEQDLTAWPEVSSDDIEWRRGAGGQGHAALREWAAPGDVGGRPGPDVSVSRGEEEERKLRRAFVSLVRDHVTLVFRQRPVALCCRDRAERTGSGGLMRGIILAADRTRCTRSRWASASSGRRCRQADDLLPAVHLMMAGIRDIQVITTADEDRVSPIARRFGIDLSYTVQEQPKSVRRRHSSSAPTTSVTDSVALVLGDNLGYGPSLGTSPDPIKMSAAVRNCVAGGQPVRVRWWSSDDGTRAVAGGEARDAEVALRGSRPSLRQRRRRDRTRHESFRARRMQSPTSIRRTRWLSFERLARAHAWLDTGTFDSRCSTPAITCAHRTQAGFEDRGTSGMARRLYLTTSSWLPAQSPVEVWLRGISSGAPAGG